MNYSTSVLNRLSRRVAKGPAASAPTTQEPTPDAKGVYQGNCNRTACQLPGATWYNRATRRYYCGSCALLINMASNEADNLRLLGHAVICVKRTAENNPEQA